MRCLILLAAVLVAVTYGQTNNNNNYNRNNDDGGYNSDYIPHRRSPMPSRYYSNSRRSRIYMAPDGRTYFQGRGELVDTKTGNRYPADRRGVYRLPNSDGWGQSFYVYPEGSTFTMIDGRSHKISLGENGQKYYTDRYGETSYREGDRVYYRERSGRTYWRDRNGIRHFRNTNDDSTYTMDRYGNRYITRADGSRWISSVNNCNYRVNNDGSTTRTINDSLCPGRFTGTSPKGERYGYDNNNNNANNNNNNP